MTREKALNILSQFLKEWHFNTKEIDLYKALEVAIGDMVLVINILSVYEDDSIGEDWLLIIDDMIKGFIEKENK